jgi:thioredoxin 1
MFPTLTRLQGNKMLKRIFTLTILVSLFLACSGDKPYNESADAKSDVRQALVEVKENHLPLVLIFGANWCPDCRALSEALTSGKNAVNIAKEFKIVKIDVGNFDHNLDVANAYGNPISGGIPGAAFVSADNTVLYVTKPGELSTARNSGDDGIYDYLKKVSVNFKS